MAGGLEEMSMRDPRSRGSSVLNVISIDVEEIYHAELARRDAPRLKLSLKPRALVGVRKALSLLEEHGVHATFFFVGEVAELDPGLPEELEERGHEVGFHGYHHKPLWELSPEGLREEIRAFKRLVQVRCVGFRAPSFSLDLRTSWALRVLAEEGFSYDSSVMPTRTPLYGLPGAPTRPYRPSLSDPRVEDESSPLLEFPATTLGLGPLRLPLTGGFYLRATPVRLLLAVIKRLNRCGLPAVLYVHTWELDPKTPLVPLRGPAKVFATYYSLTSTVRKLKYLLSQARFTSFMDYVERRGP